MQKQTVCRNGGAVELSQHKKAKHHNDKGLATSGINKPAK